MLWFCLYCYYFQEYVADVWDSVPDHLHLPGGPHLLLPGPHFCGDDGHQYHGLVTTMQLTNIMDQSSLITRQVTNIMDQSSPCQLTNITGQSSPCQLTNIMGQSSPCQLTNIIGQSPPCQLTNIMGWPPHVSSPITAC